MYLNFLTKEEKRQYLNLAIIAANSNDSFEDKEKEFISGYQREMGISLEPAEFGPEDNEESVFRFFSMSEISHKKIVLFEILGLLSCDSKFDENEKRFVFRLINAIGLSADDVDTISQLASRYFDIVAEIASSIFVQ